MDTYRRRVRAFLTLQELPVKLRYPWNIVFNKSAEASHFYTPRICPSLKDGITSERKKTLSRALRQKSGAAKASSVVPGTFRQF